uniref:DUF5725 domain-containing protein n=1 Tax=Schistosoma mansoni TaxID=6183 RepID=A0A5K4EQD6_SCHMA
MNLSAINVTHSIDSLSLPSSPELLNTNTLITTTNNHIINSNLSSTIEVNTKLNGNELKSTSNLYHSHPQQHQHHHHRHHNHHHHQQQQQHHYHSNYQQPNHEMTLSSTPSTTSPSSSSASPSSSVPSMSTSNGILSMNQLTNSLYFPLTSNIILQESINLIYSTCLNIFDKRLNDELNKFNQKYEFLLNECNESRIRLNKLENIIQLYEEKYHKMNIPSPLLPSSSLPSSSSFSSSSSTSPSSLSSSSYYYLYNSLKSQQFNESIDNHIMNTLKNIDHKWLINWKNYEDYSNNKQNHFLAPKTTSGLDEQQQRQQQQQEQQSLQKMNKMKENPIEYDINHLSNTSINDNVNHQSNFFNESNLSRLYNNNNNFCNFDNLLPSSLTLNNQHLLWNQWMANFITTNHCINSINGLLSSSSTPLPSSPSSLPSHSILNNLEKINNFTTSNMESMEGNQVSCYDFEQFLFS